MVVGCAVANLSQEHSKWHQHAESWVRRAYDVHMIVLFGIGTVLVLTLAAVFLYDAAKSRRSAQFEEHMDRHMGSITEHRVRRNFNQGP